MSCAIPLPEDKAEQALLASSYSPGPCRGWNTFARAAVLGTVVLVFIGADYYWQDTAHTLWHMTGAGVRLPTHLTRAAPLHPTRPLPLNSIPIYNLPGFFKQATADFKPKRVPVTLRAAPRDDELDMEDERAEKPGTKRNSAWKVEDAAFEEDDEKEEEELDDEDEEEWDDESEESSQAINEGEGSDSGNPLSLKEVDWSADSLDVDEAEKMPGPRVLPRGAVREPYEPHRKLDGRTLLQELEEGTVVKGKVRCHDYHYGLTVDFGSEYDGVVYVDKLDLPDVVDVADVGTAVTARITKVYKQFVHRWVFPVELELLEPDISVYLLEPPRKYPPIKIYAEERMSLEEIAAEAGRPVPVVDVRADKDKEFAPVMADIARMTAEEEIREQAKKKRKKLEEDEDLDANDVNVLEGMDRADFSEDEDHDEGDIPDHDPQAY